MNELNIGIIGLGSVARVHARLLRKHVTGARVTGAYSATKDTTSNFSEEFACDAFTNAKDLIFSKTTQAVLVTSPDETHEQYVQMCLDAGKPVLCEKSLTPTADGSRRLMQSELRIGQRLITVGFMRRYDTAYRQMRLTLREGGIGSPKVVHSTHRNPAPAPGYLWQHGFTGVAIHDIDIISWLLDDSIAQVVTVSGEREDKAGVEPLLISGKTAGGAVFSIESFVNCGYGYDIGCEVAGTAGSVSLASNDALSLRQDFRQSKKIPEGYAVRFESAFIRQLQAWCEAASAGAATGASLWDGLKASLVSDAAIQAYRSGCVEVVVYPAVPSIYRQQEASSSLPRQ